MAQTDAEARKEWLAADLDRSGSIDFSEFCRLGKRKKVLCTLPHKLQADPGKVEQAASVIQGRLRSRTDGGGGSGSLPCAGTPAARTVPPPPMAGSSSSGSGAYETEGLNPFDRQLWRTFDALLAGGDGSDTLSRREIDGALWAARFKMGQLQTSELAKIFARADVNKDGRIDWEEFKKLGKLAPSLADLAPPAKPLAREDLGAEVVYVLSPLIGAEELAILRAMAEMLEHCLDGWVRARSSPCSPMPSLLPHQAPRWQHRVRRPLLACDAQGRAKHTPPHHHTTTKPAQPARLQS